LPDEFPVKKKKVYEIFTQNRDTKHKELELFRTLSEDKVNDKFSVS
jgi:hypothetical protein